MELNFCEDRRIIRSRLSRPGSLGWAPSSTPHPPPRTFKYYQQHSRGARPQTPERPVGQSQGWPDRHWLEPVGGRRIVKVHCHLRGGQPWHQAVPEGRQGKGRAQVRGHRPWGRAIAFSKKRDWQRIRRRNLEGRGGRGRSDGSRGNE